MSAAPRTPSARTLDIPTGLGGTGVDELSLVAEFGHAIGGPSVTGLNSSDDRPVVARAARGDRDARSGRRQVSGHPNLFPNSWARDQLVAAVAAGADQRRQDRDLVVQLRREGRHRRSERAMQVSSANHVFGPAGMLEQEDGENWAQSTLQTRGSRSRHIPQLLKMDLGRGKVIKEHGLARIEGTTAEHAQLWTYHAWAQWMKGLDWDELRKATTPPDVM